MNLRITLDKTAIRLAAICLSFGLLASTASSTSAAEFFFRDGDRIVVMGDSITEQHLYSNYLETWITTRFPKWNLAFRNIGIGGDSSTGGNGRFQRDVVSFKPTAMTVDFGMNDGGYRPYDKAIFDRYMLGLQGIADQAKKAGVRVAWCTPQPLDGPEGGDTALTGYNLTLEKLSEGVKANAEKNAGLFVDQFHPYMAVLDKARSDKSKRYARITAGDAVHPGPPGQAVMAYSILQGLNFPTFVSSVEIDAADLKSAKGEKCQVSAVARDGDTLTFDRLDESLPFFPQDAAPILPWTSIRDLANDYRLTVRGLKPGSYEVKLGDKSVAKYTAEELAAGVNLATPALAAGPVADQVNDIRKAIEAKNKFYHDRIFRGIILSSVSIPDYLGIKLTPQEIESKKQAAIAERTQELPTLEAAIRKTLELKSHKVTIAPAK
ncbi:MAG: SGNH/GDSL hydrolase family protein [Planctomycetia bacterium]|nr:SGNH/GDSL hydrolase family protein [Planctomycetia bacterium]